MLWSDTKIAYHLIKFVVQSKFYIGCYYKHYKEILTCKSYDLKHKYTSIIQVKKTQISILLCTRYSSICDILPHKFWLLNNGRH